MNDFTERQKKALESLEDAFKKLDEFVKNTTCDWCAEKGKKILEAAKQLKKTQNAIYTMSKQVKDIEKTMGEVETQSEAEKEKKEPNGSKTDLLKPLKDFLGSFGTVGTYSIAEPSKKKELGLNLEDWVHGTMGSPGIVVDPDIAARTPCTCYKIDETEICFSRGIIGALDEAQREAYCPTKKYKFGEGIERRVRAFKECAEEHKGKPLPEYLKSMGKCLRAKGIEI